MATSRSHSASHRRFDRSYFWIVPLAIGLVVIAGFAVRPKTSRAPVLTNTAPPLTITTADGVTLAAQLTLPPGTSRVPAVIAIHSFGQDRHEWDPFISEFTTEGFAVLTYDVRGFGESPLQAVPSDQAAWLNSMPLDVAAVIDYLKQQSRIDSEKINLIGASLGANIAYVASGSGFGVHRTVLLSPSVTAGVLDGTGIENFAPQDVLGVAGTTEKHDLDTVMSHVALAHEQIDIDGGPLGTLLFTHQQTLASTLTWLQS